MALDRPLSISISFYGLDDIDCNYEIIRLYAGRQQLCKPVDSAVKTSGRIDASTNYYDHL